MIERPFVQSMSALGLGRTPLCSQGLPQARAEDVSALLRRLFVLEMSMLAFVVCIAALPVIKKQADSEARQNAYRLKGGYTIPVIALGVCVWMASYSSIESWKFVAGLLAAGLVLFWIEKSLLKSRQ